MRINHNISAMNTYRQYSANSQAVSNSMEKLSSGLRINKAADDAAGLSISEKMRSQIRGLTQATRNTQDGNSFIQTAEGALTEVSDMLGRLKELTVQVQNGTYSTHDQANLGAEMNSLGTAISNIYQNTKFNGIAVFGAQSTLGTSGNNGSTEVASIAYGEDGGQAVSIKAAKSTDLSTLIGLTNSATTYTGAKAVTSSAVEKAIDEVNAQRATYGAQENQLDHVTNNLSATQENLQAAESRIRDVDMAEEMTTYTKNNILLQAAQSMLAQANAEPQNVLQLLK